MERLTDKIYASLHMAEEGYSSETIDKIISYNPPRPRGWPGKPRDCMTCVNRPKNIKYEEQARGECDAGELMDMEAPCSSYQPNLKERIKRWVKGE